MQELPIDIHTNKLLDWLISRRHCERSWQESALEIRGKVNHAIQDMPEHPEIVRLLSGAHINYFHCLKIVDILKETEKDTKNLFGFYGSQRMKDWQEVVKLYENKNVGLAEAAQILIRNVNYEIPGTKKQLAKLEQTQTDCDKREQDCVKNAKLMRDQYEASCNQLGLKGEHLKKEILHLLDQLPEVFADIAEKSKAVSAALAYYRAFVTFVNPAVEADQLLPTLAYLIENGDVTVYQWRYGEAPLRVEPPPPPVSLTEEPEQKAADTSNQIDFGDEVEIDFGGADVIDFGDGGGAVAAVDSGEIDWGTLEDDPAEGFVTLDSSELDELQGGVSGVVDIVVEDSGVEGGVARDSEALSLLDSAHTRAVIINELMELETFLVQRVSEMSDSRQDSMVSMSHMQMAPQSVQLETVESVTEMLARTRAVLDSLRTVKLQHLFLVKTSPRYVDRLVGSLCQKLEVAGKLTGSVEVVRERRRTAAEEAAALQPRLALIVEKTRQLQRELESAISSKYKGRPVNLMGGVNAL